MIFLFYQNVNYSKLWLLFLNYIKQAYNLKPTVLNNPLFQTVPSWVVPSAAGTAGGGQKYHKSSMIFFLLFSLMLSYVKVHLDKNLNTINIYKNNFKYYDNWVIFLIVN